MKEIKVTEINGIKIGNAQDQCGGTGCTAIICEKGAVAGVDVRGGAPASRETELLRPEKMMEKINCVMLSGGSAFGLEAGDGAMQYLEERGIGFGTGFGIVPIVCGASIFDLQVGDSKCRPDKQMGYDACRASEHGEPQTGCFGAGTGASVGKYLGPDRMMKSGLGIYAVRLENIQCAAVVVVNALGDVIDYETHERIAGVLSKDGMNILNTEQLMYNGIESQKEIFSGNTTLGCIITNADITKNQANKLASVAHNGYANAIRPVHTSVDGDTVFVMSTGEKQVAADALGALATEVTARAIKNAIMSAESSYGLKSSHDLL